MSEERSGEKDAAQPGTVAWIDVNSGDQRAIDVLALRCDDGYWKWAGGIASDKYVTNVRPARVFPPAEKGQADA